MSRVRPRERGHFSSSPSLDQRATMSKSSRSAPNGCFEPVSLRAQLACLLLVALHSSSGVSAARHLTAAAAVPESGISYYSRQNFPLSLDRTPSFPGMPPKGFEQIADAAFLFFGRDVLANRTDLETAFCETSNALQIPELKMRTRNYTMHPSQTPGLENYAAVVEHVRHYKYLSAPIVLDYMFNAQSVYSVWGLIQATMAQRERPATFFMNHYTVTAPWWHVMTRNVPADHRNILSRIQITGNNLLPFYFDKQTLFLETVYNLFQADSMPVATLNFSNWKAAEESVSIDSQGKTDTILVDIWTSIAPNGSITPAAVWAKLESPDSRMWETTGLLGVPMNPTVNGIPDITVIPDQTPIILSSTPASSGLSSGAIVGVTCAAVLALAIGLALILFMLRRRKQVPKGKSMTAFKMEGQINPGEIVICKRADGSDWLLGQGNFAQVYKATRRGITLVAVKKFKFQLDEVAVKMIYREIAILRKASDQNIVQFYGASVTDSALLCMEYMEGGDLRTALSEERRLGLHVFDWISKGKHVALSVAQGLDFLHTIGVIHRDVKSSNVLLTKEGVAKVSDVGMAEMDGYFSSSTSSGSSGSSPAGTFNYAAPELLMAVKCTPQVDVFSFGVLLWELATKELPQRGQLRDLRVPEECPSDVAALIDDCMRSDPEARPAMKEVVERLQITPDLVT